MQSYELELSPASKRDLKKLHHKIQKEIAFKHLPAIKENPYKAGQPLVGAFNNERSYHFGRKPEYRIIYYIEKELITVTIIGSRENIYQKAKRRFKRK